jgi:short subunit dehydrogenase
MDLGLRGAAVVSGSTAGIGLAIATALAAEGAKVVVNGRTEARVVAALDKIRQRVANAELRGVAADLGTANGVDAFLKQVTEADVLVNNLGIFEVKAFAEIPDADWMRLFEVLSGVRLTRKYLLRMLKKNWGRVAFISSESGQHIPAEMIPYGMTKNRPGGRRARRRGIRGRNRCHRELCSGGPDRVGRRRQVRREHGEATKHFGSRSGKAILRDGTSHLAQTL